MTLKEKAIILLVAYAIRCLFPSKKNSDDYGSYRHSSSEGQGYDDAIKELIDLLKKEK